MTTFFPENQPAPLPVAFTLPEGLIRAKRTLQQTDLPRCQQLGPKWCACARCQIDSIIAQLESVHHAVTTTYFVASPADPVDASRSVCDGTISRAHEIENGMVVGS